MEHSRACLPVAIVIPARDEEAVLAATLAAAVQSRAAEIVVIDDNSRDATPRIVAEWSRRDGRVRGMAAGRLPPGWTGKNHAVWQGACATGQPWLLFLDADTRLLAGGLAAAWAWAGERGLDALSVSPGQEMGSFWERAVQPAIFSRLGRRFPFEQINDPGHPAAAANGQFILVRRDVYFCVGGHEALRAEVLEDVELARRIKQAGYRFEFRSGGEWVRTRMYHDLGGLWLGWSKNLYLLFGEPGRGGRAALCFLPLLGLSAALLALGLGWWRVALGLTGIIGLAHLRYAAELHHAGWRGARYLIPGSALLGLLWLSSARAHRRAQSVRWKGRSIPVSAGGCPPADGAAASAAVASSPLE